MISCPNVNKIKRICECLKKNKEEGVFGSILEFGVFEGCSLLEMALFCRENKFDYPIYGFDGFVGQPYSEYHWNKGEAYSTYENTCLELTKKLGNLDNIFLVKGLFENSLTEELKITIPKIPKAILIHIDCDFYLSSTQALLFCESLIQDDTFIVFDEFIYPYEGLAWDEFIQRTKYKFEEIKFNKDEFGDLDDQKIFRIIK